MKQYTLEICVDSVESALAAAGGGAGRLELCGHLSLGGVTPTASLFKEIRKNSKIEMNVLIRPRSGDFCYSEYEFNMIKEDIISFRELGADGIVIGALDSDGSLDTAHLEILLREAGRMHKTLHRCFDVCSHPFDALEQAVALGFDTILTSGQKNTAPQGSELLARLKKAACGRIDIMAGSGIDANAIEKLYPLTKITSYHMSGKKTIESRMSYRKEDVSMGSPAINEFERWETDEQLVRNAVNALKSL